MAKKIRVCKGCGRQIPSGVTDCGICGAGEQSVTFRSAPTSSPLQESSHKGGGARRREGLHYPGLYSQSRSLERLDKSTLLSIPYSPKKAFKSLYPSTTLKGAVAFLAVTSILVGAWSLLWVHVLDKSASSTAFEWSQVIEQGSLVFATLGLTAILGAYFSRRVFRGRGDYRSSFILMSYFAPWESVFVVCSSFLSWEPASHLVASLIFMGAFFVWRLWVCGTALSVANDISIGQGVRATFIALYAYGIILIFAGIVASGGSWESESTAMMSLIVIFFVLLTLKMKPRPRTSNR